MGQASRMRAWHLVVVIAAAGIFFLTRPPSGVKLVREMDIDVAAGSIAYRGVVYTSEWGAEITRSGQVRHVVRAYDKNVPIVTFHLVLTTGEFSDPSIVTIDHNGGGNYIWRAKKQPQGTLIVLHLVPGSETVFRTLRSVDEGDTVEIVGRDEARGAIENENGAYLRLGHSNHKFVLVNRVRIS